MKNIINNLEKENISIVQKQQIEPEVEKILVDSVDLKNGHSLFEIKSVEGGFEFNLVEHKKPKEIIYQFINGKWVLKKEERKIVKIDIFNFDNTSTKENKNVYNFDKKEGCNYVTALNRKNAIDRFFKVNSHLNRNKYIIY